MRVRIRRLRDRNPSKSVEDWLMHHEDGSADLDGDME